MDEISIRNITTMNRLITYCIKVLGWHADTDDFEEIEDISYDFDAEDLGLKEEAFAKIKSLRELQPFVDGQKWGIFSVEFDSKKFEVTALRKVLSALIPKKRNSADHVVWDLKDLLFICFWGEENNRTIGIAHFEEKYPMNHLYLRNGMIVSHVLAWSLLFCNSLYLHKWLVCSRKVHHNT